MLARPRIPLFAKLVYTLFSAVMVPSYLRTYGPANFLYFCDVAVLITLVGIWIESPLLISMQALSILIIQSLWLIDFASSAIGVHFLGMTGYMFDPQYSLMVRGLSLFHGWMPLLILWLVYRLGYDRRALKYQTAACVLLLSICYFGFVPPGTVSSWRRAININFVFGFSNDHQQTAMAPLAWLGMLMVGIPVMLYLPTHFLLMRIFRQPDRSRKELLPQMKTDEHR